MPIPPEAPAQEAENDAWNIGVLIVLAAFVAIFFIGRSLGRTPAAPAPTTMQTNVNLPPQPEQPLPPAPPPPAPPPALQRRFVYYPGTDTIPPRDTPPIYDRTHTITIELVRSEAHEEGVLLALGSMQAGYVIYIKDERLVYTLALGSVTRQVLPNAVVPIGLVRVRFEFNRTGLCRGTGALFINEQLVGAQIFEHTIPLPPSEGLDIGIDRGMPVTSDYPAPFPFGGRIESVLYELNADSAADARSEA